MKVRSDFVTNSSSSSFILGRKGELSEAQKNAVIAYVEKTFLGEKVLSKDSTEEEIQKVIEEDWDVEQNEECIREMIKNGQDVYVGSVNFEDCAYEIADVYEELWHILEEADDNFKIVDGDLSY